MIDAAADAGAWGVKLQCHEGDPVNRFRPGTEQNFPQDETRQAFWRRTAFTREQWKGLANHASVRNLTFGCSVFSVAGVQLLDGIVDWWKVPSGCIGNQTIGHELKRTGKPVVLSSGMSSLDGLYYFVAGFWDGHDVTLLQCTTEYPCPAEHVGLNNLRLLPMTRFDWGLSDHSGVIWPGIAAAVLGAHMLEVHVCWSKSQWGPDVAASLTFEELKQLVEGVRFVEKMMANPVDKDRMAETLTGMREIFRNTGTQGTCKPLESSATGS